MAREGQGFGVGGDSAELGRAGWGFGDDGGSGVWLCDILRVLSRWSCSVFAFCPLLGGVLSGLY